MKAEGWMNRRGAEGRKKWGWILNSDSSRLTSPKLLPFLHPKRSAGSGAEYCPLFTYFIPSHFQRCFSLFCAVEKSERKLLGKEGEHFFDRLFNAGRESARNDRMADV